MEQNLKVNKKESKNSQPVSQPQSKEINKLIALELMKEVKRGKDINTIFSRVKISEILNKIENDKTGEGYYHIHQSLSGDNKNVIDNFTANEAKLFDSLVREIPSRVKFDIQIYKIRQTWKCSPANRYGIFIKEEGFFTSKSSQDTKFIKSQCNDKTEILLKSEIKYEQKSKDHKKQFPAEWHDPSNEYRIILKYKYAEKAKYICLYFKDAEQVEEIKELIFGIKSLRNANDKLVSNLTAMQKMIEGSHLFYGVFKILEVKNRVKKRKLLLQGMKNQIEESVGCLKKFGSSLFDNIFKSYLKIQKNQVFNCNDNGDKKEIVNPSSLLLNLSFTKNKYYNIEKPSSLDNYNFSNIIDVSKKVQKIFSNFPNYFHTIFRMRKSANKVNKEVPIKFSQTDFCMKSFNQDQDEINMLKCIPSFQPSSKSDRNSFSVDRKKIEIVFSNKSKVTQKDLLQISSVFLHLDLQSRHNENYLTINGPKIDPKKFFQYCFRQNSNIDSNQRFIEPEYHSLTYNQSNKFYTPLNIQIFHTIVCFSKKDLEYLEHKSSGKNYKFNYENPVEDFFFFIQIGLTDSDYKMKTKLVKAHKYVKERLIIEFNLSHFFNLESLEQFNKNLQMRVSLHLVPVKCYNDKNLTEKEMNFYVDYLNPYELGHCYVNRKHIENNEHSFTLQRENIQIRDSDTIPPEENKIIMNFSHDYNNNFDLITQPLFYGKEFNVGNDIYALEELDWKFFLLKMKDSNVDQRVKDKFYNINFSHDNSILLNVQDNQTLENLSTEAKISQEELKKIILNNNFDFLPYCEKFVSKNDLNDRFNLNVYADDIVKMKKNKLKEGDWIYKIKNLKSFFLSNFKGVTKDGHFVYHNYFTNETKSHKIDDKGSEITSFKSAEKYFIPIQENLFGIYDFNEIDPDGNDIKNVGDNFLWKIGVKFNSPSEMKDFIYTLKDLRRRANIKNKQERMIIDSPIKVSSLTSMTNKLIKSLRSLRVSVEAIEFRQIFELNEDKILTVTLDKIDSHNHKQKKYLLESLEESEGFKFRNSLIFDEDVNRDFNKLLNSNATSKSLEQTLLKMEAFTKNNKRVEFPKGEDEDSLKHKAFNIEVIPKADTDYIFKIALNRLQTNTEESFRAPINFDNIINFNPKADIFLLPLYDKNDRVMGILHLNVWACDSNDRNLQFSTLYKQMLLQTCPNEFLDDHKNFLSLGRYEPNVEKRLLLKQIQSEFKLDIDSLSKLVQSNYHKDKQARSKLQSFLQQHMLRHDLSEECWQDLLVDMKQRKNNLYNRYYEIKKRNDFYGIFSEKEWTFRLKEIFANFKPGHNEDNNIYSEFFSKKDYIIELKNKRNEDFYKLRFLYYLGLPEKRRLTIWGKMLEIEKLIEMTKEKLDMKCEKIKSEKNEETSKKEIYEYFNKLSENHQKFNINFSLIENDIKYLTSISHSNDDVLIVKNIAKAFYLWSELNITTDKFITRESGTVAKLLNYFTKSESKPEKKFVYFFGLLKIIQKLFSVFKNESVTFWIIIGLSQTIELFYQSDPLQTNELTYHKIYVLISKLVMERNLRGIYSKILELGFPIEYFLYKLINTLFSDVFHTELFLRLLDIIIFEAALKTNQIDQYDYIRIICTIPLTLLKNNEDKLMQCRTVRELEVVFEDLNFESFNIQGFLEKVRDNVDDFYGKDNILNEILNEIDNKNVKHNSKTFTWDDKRNSIENKLEKYFQNVHKENKNFLNPISQLRPLSNSSEFIQKYEKISEEKLPNIRKVFSTGTPGAVNNNKPNSRKVFSTGTPDAVDNNKPGLCFSITEFFWIKNKTSVSSHEELIAFFVFDNTIKDFNIEDFKSVTQTFIKFGSNNISTDGKADNKVIETGIVKQDFQNALPKYMNILIVDKKNTSNVVGRYFINIIKLDLMRPHKIKLESIDKVNKTVIEICLFKYSLEKVSDEESNLYNFLFKEPNYIYDNNLNKEIDEVQVLSEKEVEEVNKIFSGNVKENLQKLKKEFKVEENFIYREYEKHFGLLNPIEKPPKQMKDILESIFNNKEKTSKLVTEWLKTNESSFEEILYAIILVDPSSLTIYEKLQLLFDVARTQNYLIHNEDKLSVPKLKELVYSLYKRYMVYFTKSDVDRLVDYILNKENLCNFKYAVLYNDKKCKEVENVINDKGHAPVSPIDILSFSGDKKLFAEVRNSLVSLIETLKNQFRAKSLPLNVITSLANYICRKENISDKANKMRIELEVDKVRKSIVLEANITKNTNIGIKPHNNNNNSSLDVKLTEIKENTKTFTSIDSDNSVLYSIIIDEAKSLEISNCNNNEISFDKFKDIFFALPFISDLFRASCAFNLDLEEKNTVKDLANVKVEVCICTPERISIGNFLFTNDEDININSNRKSVAKNPINMKTSLKSSANINEIFGLIEDLIEEKLKERSDLQLGSFSKDPELTTFLVINKSRNPMDTLINETSKYTGLEERIGFYDPLNSNSYIRNADTKSLIELVFILASTAEITKVGKELMVKESGYAKFRNVNDSDHYQWRECFVKDEGGKKFVEFKSLDPKSKNNLINFLDNLSANENDFFIVEEY